MPLSRRCAPTLAALVLSLVFAGPLPLIGQQLSLHAQRTERELTPVAEQGVGRLPGASVASFPAVVAVLDGVDVLCSGVLVTSDAVLTSADCALATGDPGTLEVQSSLAGRFAVSGAVIADGSASPVPALLFLDRPSPGPVMPMVATRPPDGTAALVVGFGLEAGGLLRSGVKRSASSQFLDCAAAADPDAICWRPAAAVVPLPAECRPGGGSAVLARTEAGWKLAALSGPASPCGSPGTGPDLAAWRPWLESRLGPLPASSVSGTSWRLLSSETSLDPLNPVQFFRFRVPPGVRTLVVSLDGEDGHSFSDTAWLPNDFDLYARKGLHPDASDWDCRPFALGSHEGCVIERPESGLWYLRAEHFEGAGVLQVTAAMRLGTDTLFADDFESGDLLEWSGSAGSD